LLRRRNPKEEKSYFNLVFLTLMRPRFNYSKK
jgi:hypothetical protein